MTAASSASLISPARPRNLAIPCGAVATIRCNGIGGSKRRHADRLPHGRSGPNISSVQPRPERQHYRPFFDVGATGDAIAPIPSVIPHCSETSMRANSDRNSIENSSPAAVVEISLRSIFGSKTSDASAATHSSSCDGELDRRHYTQDFLVSFLANIH